MKNSKEYNNKYYELNKAKRKRQQKAYYYRHLEERLAKQRERYAKKKADTEKMSDTVSDK